MKPDQIAVGCALANKLGRVPMERLEAARKYRHQIEQEATEV